LNETTVPQRDVEKVYYWMRNAIPFVIEKDMREKYNAGLEDFFSYLEIEDATPGFAKKYAKSAEFALGSPMGIIIAKVKDHLKELKKFEAKLPEIEKIMKSVESDLKKIK
jgi:phage-related minor tail protein